MKGVFLDDIKTPKDFPSSIDGWVVIRDYDAFVTFVKDFYEENKEFPPLFSLEHDLNEEHFEFYFNNKKGTKPFYENFKVKTGMHCLVWLFKYADSVGERLKTRIAIHSENLACAYAMVRYANGMNSDTVAFEMKWDYAPLDYNDEKVKKYIQLKTKASYGAY